MYQFHYETEEELNESKKKGGLSLSEYKIFLDFIKRTEMHIRDNDLNPDSGSAAPNFIFASVALVIMKSFVENEIASYEEMLEDEKAMILNGDKPIPEPEDWQKYKSLCESNQIYFDDLCKLTGLKEWQINRLLGKSDKMSSCYDAAGIIARKEAKVAGYYKFP